MALLPLIGLAALVTFVAVSDPVERLTDAPVAESIAFERTVLEPELIRLHVRNDGAGEVTVAQVMVDDAFWSHTVTPRTIGRLGTATVSVPYPWETGVPLEVSLLTSTGARFSHEVPSPALTPVVEAESLWDYAVLGLVIGVIPVALGLLWLPVLRRATQAVVQFALALTVGLLAFLLADTVAEGLELGRDAPGLHGTELFAVGFLAVVAVLACVEAWAGRRRASAGTGSPAGGRGPSGPIGAGNVALAYLVAFGIGMHNLGEGLAVGAAVAAGEVALGTSLVIGFAAHNTTEGLAIASPLAGPPGDTRARAALQSGESSARAWAGVPLGHLLALGLLAGLPTVLGAWGGAFVTTPAWSALAFGVAAGAIAQVGWAVGRTVVRNDGVTATAALGFVTGLVVMYLTSLLVAA